MALVVKDRVKVTTATTGTGTLTLGSAVAGFQAFSAVLSNADTTYYAIFESSTGAFEVGLGTYASPANTLARTTVLESSNAGSAINLLAGDADVFITYAAEKSVYLDASGHIFVSDGRNLTNLNATNLTTGTVNDARLPATISSDITGNAATATAWATGRTLALTGDVTGTSAAFDGSGNITLSTAIAANSVALGTDTTGNYVATGAVSGSGLSGSASAEGATFTVTSNATNANTPSTIVFRDGSGNFSAGTITAALNGNASTASTLQTARDIALTGAVTGNANFNGGGNISITTTATSDPTLTLAGDVTGSATFTNLGNATLTVGVVDNYTRAPSGPSGDFNTQTSYSYVSAFNATANTPFGNAWYNLVNIRHRGGVGDGVSWGAQIVTGMTAHQNRMAMRTQSNGVWSSWSEIWNAGNDGAGSGLDADLLDGLQGSSYLRSDTADTFDGVLTVTSGIVLNNGAADGSGVTFASSGNPSWDIDNLNGQLRFFQSGVVYAALTSSALTLTNNLVIPNQIIHNGDTDTYLQFHAADQFRVVTGNVERFEINNNDVTVQSALKEKYVALSGTTPSIDVDAGGAFSLTTSGNTTFTFVAFSSALSCAFILELTAGGAHTITWPASVEWAGGTAPDAPASGETNIYVFWSRDGGTTWYGVLSSAAAA